MTRGGFSLAIERGCVRGRGSRDESTSSVRKLSSRALLITASATEEGAGAGERHAHLHFPEGPFRSYSAASPGSGSAVI